MKCPHCKKEIADSAVFCGYCGSEVHAFEQTDEDAKNKKNPGVVIAAIVLIALLVILGVLLYILLKPADDANTPTESNRYETSVEPEGKHEESSAGNIEESSGTNIDEISKEPSIETSEETTIEPLTTENAEESMKPDESMSSEVSSEPEESQEVEKEEQSKQETELASLQDLTSLSVLSCTNSTGGANSVNNPDEDVAIGSFTDVHGNTHEQAIKFWVVNRAGYTNTESITYDVSGYSMMTGEVVCARLKSGRCERNASMYIRFYLDNVLIYESKPIDEYSLPEEYTIDLTGGSILQIECYTDEAFFGESLLSGKLK